MAKGRTRLSAQIRIWQGKTGLDNAALAEKAGVNVDSIYRIKRGEVGAGIDMIESIADAFGFDLLVLLMPVDTD